jgi:hypothetical protein
MAERRLQGQHTSEAAAKNLPWKEQNFKACLGNNKAKEMFHFVGKCNLPDC